MKIMFVCFLNEHIFKQNHFLNKTSWFFVKCKIGQIMI